MPDLVSQPSGPHSSVPVPVPGPLPTPSPGGAYDSALALTAVDSARSLLTSAQGPRFSPEQAFALSVQLRALASTAPPDVAASLEGTASALERAGSSALVAGLQGARPAGAQARSTPDSQALRLLDALADVHVARGRPTVEITSRIVRDLGTSGLLQLSARVGFGDVTAAMTRHGATATEAYAVAERLAANAAESLHVAAYDGVLAGLRERLREVRALAAPEQRETTLRAVLSGELNLGGHMVAVSRVSEAAELTELTARLRTATPAERPALEARARVLVQGALADIERVLRTHVNFMPTHLRDDELLDLQRFFPQVFRRVAREAGLSPQAAVALGTAPGGTLLERAWAART
ncbi:MAG: hypothetical protein KC593_05515, partial [Myxococcales bacterium]|nr:hypothetical protein [Myxococcales bacterium]